MWYCVKFHSFLLQSDIWSFGVLLWEIVTWGDNPYKNVSSLDVLLQLIQDDYRLARPHHCPEELYQLMCECWAYEVVIISYKIVTLTNVPSRVPALL